MTRPIFFLLFFILLNIPSFGQNVPLTPVGFRQRFYWINGNETFWFKPDSHEFIITSPKGARINKLPDGLISPNYFDGKVWGIKLKTRSGEIEEAFLLTSDDQKSWTTVASIDRINGEPYDLYPLSKSGFFLAYNPIIGFIKNNEVGILAIFKLSEEKLELDHIVSLSTFDNIFLNVQPKKEQNFIPLAYNSKAYNSKFTGLFPFLDQLIRFDGGFAVVSTRSGRIWIYSEESGQISKTIDIYPLDETCLNENTKTEICVLAIKPMKNGSLLVATRDEFAFKHSYKFFKQTMNNTKITDQAQNDIYDEMDRSLKAFNEIVWWEINPNTGEKNRYYGEGLLHYIADRRLFMRFDFSFSLDGKVSFANSTNVVPEPSKAAPTSKDPKAPNSSSSGNKVETKEGESHAPKSKSDASPGRGMVSSVGLPPA